MFLTQLSRVLGAFAAAVCFAILFMMFGGPISGLVDGLVNQSSERGRSSADVSRFSAGMMTVFGIGLVASALGGYLLVRALQSKDKA
ncbi:MAG: hypothetical protein WD716_12805 [Fimbriimonadaceae bacterium]